MTDWGPLIRLKGKYFFNAKERKVLALLHTKSFNKNAENLFCANRNINMSTPKTRRANLIISPLKRQKEHQRFGQVRTIAQLETNDRLFSILMMLKNPKRFQRFNAPLVQIKNALVSASDKNSFENLECGKIHCYWTFVKKSQKIYFFSVFKKTFMNNVSTQNKCLPINLIFVKKKNMNLQSKSWWILKTIKISKAFAWHCTVPNQTTA